MQAVSANHYSSIMVFIDIFVSPKSVFERLGKLKVLSLLALLVLCSFVFLSEYMFYNNMSPEWIVSQQMLYVDEALPEEQKEMVSQMLLSSAENTGVVNGAFSVISQLVFVLVLSIYFFIVAKVYKINNDKKYADWFSFAVWVAMPAVIQAIGLIMLFVSAKSPDLPITLSQYASFNQLFLGYPETHQFFTLTSSMNLFYIWSILIASIGLKQIAGFTFLKSLSISVLPFLTVYSVWFFIA